MTERWRDLVGFDGVYQISDCGNIRRAIDGCGGTYAGRALRAAIDAHGYRSLTLRHPQTKRSVLVRPHVSVLEAFVGPRPAGCDASHLNGTKTDNSLQNLCWETSSANHRRKLGHGTLVHGEKHRCSKLKTEQVAQIRRRVNAGELKAHLAREFGVSKTLVGWIISGKAWPHV